MEGTNSSGSSRLSRAVAAGQFKFDSMYEIMVEVTLGFELVETYLVYNPANPRNIHTN